MRNERGQFQKGHKTNVGRHLGVSHKKAISEAQKRLAEQGLHHSQINHPMKGRHRSKKVKEKLRQANLGKKASEKTREKMRVSQLGKRKSAEECRQISERMNGNQIWSGRKHSKRSRQLMSDLARKGEQSNLWKGGVTDENKIIRQTSEYKLWRKAVFEGDDYICQICGERGGKLNADHIKRFSDYPKLRFDIDNGRTLCETCHKKTETYGNVNLHSQKIKEAHNGKQRNS